MVGLEVRSARALALHADYELVVGVLIVAVAATVVAAPADRVNGLTVTLGVAAVAAGLMAAGVRGEMGVSASFIVLALAAVFLGPRSAIIAAIVSELVVAVLR